MSQHIKLWGTDLHFRYWCIKVGSSALCFELQLSMDFERLGEEMFTDVTEDILPQPLYCTRGPVVPVYTPQETVSVLFYWLLPGKADMFGSLNSHPKHSFCFCFLELCYGLDSRLNFSLANCYPNTMLNKSLFLSDASTNCSAALLSADQREKMRVRLSQSGVSLRLSQPLEKLKQMESGVQRDSTSTVGLISLGRVFSCSVGLEECQTWFWFWILGHVALTK